MSERSEQLARELEEANRALLAIVRDVPAVRWHSPGANAPGWRFDDPGDERRSVAQIALHAAKAHLVQIEVVKAVIAGGGAVSEGSSPVANAREAAAEPRPDQDEVVALLERNGATASAWLRGLTEADLDRSLTFKGYAMTAEQTVRQSQIGHLRWHAASIREALLR